MHLLFLSTANLSSNPRLVKEIRLALSKNFKATVILFDLKQWTSELEREYQNELCEVKFVYLPITRDSLFNWLRSSLARYFSNKLYSINPRSIKLSAFASDKRSLLLYKELKELKRDNYDLVIAHNLGALYPAYQVSKRFTIPFAFDVEDYHPGESIQVDAQNEKTRREFLMQQLLQNACFVTSASPLIAKEVENLCQLPVKTINNSFYSTEFVLPTSELSKEKVNLVWFSQNINHGRGLELIFPALDNFSDKVTLTLIGNLNQRFANTLLSSRSYINVKAPLLQKELHKALSEYDVGLALEISSVDLNKDLALSNKIFAYKQAGLYILATDTKAQCAFMAPYKEDGLVTEQTVDALRDGLNFIINNITEVRASKLKRFNQSKEIAFETEAQKLVALWQTALQK